MITDEKALNELYLLLQHPLSAEIIILPHADPDMDAMGASLAWAAYLRKKGHRPLIISPSLFMNNLNSLPGISDVLVYNPAENEEQVATLLQSASLICCFDFSRSSRLQQLEHLFLNTTVPKFILDHHLQPQDFATYLYHSTAVPSSTSLVLQLIRSWGEQALMDDEMATCIYAGLVSDTASFSNTRTSTFAFETAAILLQWKVDIEMVQRNIYGNLDYGMVRLLGYVLHQKIVLLKDSAACYILLSAEEITSFDQEMVDTDIFLRYAINIEDVNIAVMFVEKEDHIKVSVRTVGAFSAADFAKQYFNGGGHHNAAGAVLAQVSLKEAEGILLEALSHKEFQPNL